MGPKNSKKSKKCKKCMINNGHHPKDGPRRRSRSSWGGPGAILRGSWGGPGGSGAAPGGISGAFWGAKIGANSESAIRSNKRQKREARAAESNCESENKLKGIRATRTGSIRTNHIDCGFDSFFGWPHLLPAGPCQALKHRQA